MGCQYDELEATVKGMVEAESGCSSEKEKAGESQLGGYDGDESTTPDEEKRRSVPPKIKGADHVRVLLYEYKRSLRMIKRAKEHMDDAYTLDDQFKTDQTIMNSMISSMEYCIDWIELGRNPDLLRGADITKIYLKDPVIIENSNKYSPMYQEPSRELSLEEKGMIEDALCTLSKREREVFILYHTEGLSLQKIADLLGIEKGSAQKYFERAEKKIEERKNGSLFLVC
jgi:RNA polymerase sigma factor (sigma-70 family)